MVGNTSERCLTAGISLHLRLHGSTVVFQAAVNGCAGGPKAVRYMVAGRALTCNEQLRPIRCRAGPVRVHAAG